MKQETKNILKNTFGSLVSNQSAIDSGKTNPWWIAVIMFLVGIFLPVIPLMTSTSKTYGASFLTSTTNGFENYITAASQELKTAGYEFTVNGEHKLIAYKDNAEVARTTEQDVEPLYQYVNASTHQVDFEVYYSYREVNTGDATILKLKEQLDGRYFQLGTAVNHQHVDENDDKVCDDATCGAAFVEGETFNYYTPSYIILYPNGLYMANLKLNSRDIVSSSYSGSDWTKTEEGFKLLENVLSSSETNQTLANEKFIEDVSNNWKAVFNETFLRQKTVYFWSSTGIYTGIYAVLAIFMGLLIFLLTRGKKNMFNYLKFHTCLSIECYACLAPGILAMILGFMMSQYAMMFFIVLLGLRTMWMSMKQLRPQY